MTVMTNHNDFIHTKLIKHAISKISDYTNNYTNDVAFFSFSSITASPTSIVNKRHRILRNTK